VKRFTVSLLELLISMNDDILVMKVNIHIDEIVRIRRDKVEVILKL
jgi:hypothetical protein